MKHILLSKQSGFSVVETIIVVGIVGLFTTILLLAGTQNIQVERFSGSLRDVADAFRKGQNESYSIQSGDCPGDQECFWRGTLFEFDTNEPKQYRRYRLRGNDLSDFAANSDPQRGITGKTAKQTISLADQEMQVSGIGYNCDESAFGSGFSVESDCAGDTQQLSVAFLAPDGRTYTADETYTNAQLTESSGNSTEPPPYDDQRRLTIEMESLGTDLTGYLTFNPKNANVDVAVY
jgi:type II secretory pathway pseudopilin PulG